MRLDQTTASAFAAFTGIIGTVVAALVNSFLGGSDKGMIIGLLAVIILRL
jgi:FtsH-binding integral membrane protein